MPQRWLETNPFFFRGFLRQSKSRKENQRRRLAGRRLIGVSRNPSGVKNFFSASFAQYVLDKLRSPPKSGARPWSASEPQPSRADDPLLEATA